MQQQQQQQNEPITTIRTAAQHMDAGFIITKYGKIKTNTAYTAVGEHLEGGAFSVCFFIAHNFNSRQELYPLLCVCSYHRLQDNSMCQITPQIDYKNLTVCSDCGTIMMKFASVLGEFKNAKIQESTKQYLADFAKSSVRNGSFLESVDFYCN